LIDNGDRRQGNKAASCGDRGRVATRAAVGLDPSERLG